MDFGDIFTWVLGVLADLQAWIVQAFAVLIQAINAALNYIYGVLASAVTFILGVLRNVVNAVTHIWQDVLKPLWNRVFGAIRNVYERVRPFAVRAVQIIRKIHDYEVRQFNLYIRPVLNLIQHLRAITGALSALHIGFAKKLDKYLAGLEQKIIAVYTSEIKWTVYALDWIDLIVDPTLLFNRWIFRASILREIKTLYLGLKGIFKDFPRPSPIISPPLVQNPLGFVTLRQNIAEINAMGRAAPSFKPALDLYDWVKTNLEATQVAAPPE